MYEFHVQKYFVDFFFLVQIWLTGLIKNCFHAPFHDLKFRFIYALTEFSAYSNDKKELVRQ